MSRRNRRWTLEELEALYGKEQVNQAIAKRAQERLSAPHIAPRVSPLEAELAGHLNVMQLAPVQQHRFHDERRWRFDFAFPDVMVAVELDGGIFAAENGTTAGRHARGMGRCKDFEKRNAAAELGWLVLCYGPPQVRSGEAAVQIERIVRARRAAPPPQTPCAAPA